MSAPLALIWFYNAPRGHEAGNCGRSPAPTGLNEERPLFGLILQIHSGQMFRVEFINGALPHSSVQNKNTVDSCHVMFQ